MHCSFISPRDLLQEDEPNFHYIKDHVVCLALAAEDRQGLQMSRFVQLTLPVPLQENFHHAANHNFEASLHSFIF